MACLARLAAIALVALAACNGRPSPEPVAPARPSGYPQPGHLLPLLRLDNPRLVETAELMGRTGNEREKAAAGQRLVSLAEAVGSDDWRQKQRPAVRAAQRRRGADPSERQMEALVDDWQKRHLVRLYDAMKAVGGDPVLEHCREVVEDDDAREVEQRLAFAVLVAHDRAESRPAARRASGAPGAAGGGRPRGDASTRFGGDMVQATAPPRVTGGTIRRVADTTRALHGPFRTCYERALASHGRFGAWVTVVATVGSGGRVISAQVRAEASVPASLTSCLQGVMRQATFAPPPAGSVQVSTYWSFTPPDGSR